MKIGKLATLFIIGLLISSCRIPEMERYDPVSGTLNNKQVSAPVHVVRDANGVPHITAQNEDDLFFAIGYAMAQDRFSLMDILRRAGGGRLAEILGSPLSYKDVSIPRLDIALRAFLFEQSAEKAVASLDPQSRKQLEAFTRGVNKYLEDGGDTIAVYHAWNTRPEPWTVKDCFLTAEVMGLAQTGSSFFEEYYLERIRREMGDEVRDLFVSVYPENATIITRDTPLVSLYQDYSLPRLLYGPGSNNWAVSGKRTVSGLPLLCNDPHVPMLMIPTFWWHSHIKAGKYDVMGMMFDGFPAFGAATNGKVAWTLTNVMADYIDVWREKINPANQDEYEVDGKWVPFEKVKGEVKVRGKRPIEYTMRISKHGAVIDRKLLGWKVGNAPGEVLVLRYVDMDLGRFYRGYQQMALAGNFEEWKQGAKDEAWGPFAWNHTYADAEGNIAYWATGHFPIRADNQGYIARKGWDLSQDWKGYVPFEENPHLVNPRKGYIVTANNRTELPGYPYYITVDYVSPARSTRITELIEQKDKLDVEDMKRIQYDIQSWGARQIVPVIIKDLESAKSSELKEAADMLKEWRDHDYVADLDSRGTCVYQVFIDSFAGNVFGDELSKATARGANWAGLTSAALEKIIDDPESKWFDNVKTAKKETRRDIVESTMKDTMKYLRGKLGRDTSKWRWGDLSTITLSPSMVSIRWLTTTIKTGPFPLPGADDSVRANGHLLLGRFGFKAWEGPSTHLIVDFRNPRKAYFNCSAGMADDKDSSRYDNLTRDWLEGRYTTMSMDESDYMPGMMGDLVLMP